MVILSSKSPNVNPKSTSLVFSQLKLSLARRIIDAPRFWVCVLLLPSGFLIFQTSLFTSTDNNIEDRKRSAYWLGAWSCKPTQQKTKRLPCAFGRYQKRPSLGIDTIYYGGRFGHETKHTTLFRGSLHYDKLIGALALVNLTKKHAFLKNDELSLDLMLGAYFWKTQRHGAYMWWIHGLYRILLSKCISIWKRRCLLVY